MAYCITQRCGFIMLSVVILLSVEIKISQAADFTNVQGGGQFAAWNNGLFSQSYLKGRSKGNLSSKECTGGNHQVIPDPIVIKFIPRPKTSESITGGGYSRSLDCESCLKEKFGEDGGWQKLCKVCSRY